MHLYIHVSVFSPTREQCRDSDFARPATPSGFLASTVTADTGCGSAQTPWMITVPRGQRINVTLHDFSAVYRAINFSSSFSTYKHTGHCHVYAIIKVMIQFLY